MMWCFSSVENVMIGFGVLIQMRFTLSVVNRLGMLKSNILKIRKSILMGMILLRRYL
ncbi:hypothetical protein EAWG_01266 [Escherichia coli TA008]|nr:hypothetical protein ERHG_02082 [Escherichia coli TA007]OSL81034.1 hypothetical protein EAWG_01266 [Escherichia coli TA008]